MYRFLCKARVNRFIVLSRTKAVSWLKLRNTRNMDKKGSHFLGVLEGIRNMFWSIEALRTLTKGNVLLWCSRRDSKPLEASKPPEARQRASHYQGVWDSIRNIFEAYDSPPNFKERKHNSSVRDGFRITFWSLQSPSEPKRKGTDGFRNMFGMSFENVTVHKLEEDFFLFL